MSEAGNATFERSVVDEVFRIKVREEARKRYEEELLGTAEVPQGVLAGGTIPTGEAEIFKGLLLRHAATGIFGVKETGKSLVATEIAHSFLTGEPLWGKLEPAFVGKKVVHFLAEHHSYILQELFQQKLGFPASDNLWIYGPEHLGSHKILVSSGALRNVAVGMYKRLAAGADLVIFDPIASFIQGEANAENDNSSMRHLISAMIDIAESTAAACLILGHKGKPVMHEGRAIERDKYAARGASAIEDALAAVHYLEPLGPQSKAEFKLSPVHYKGKKAGVWHLLRDPVTLRHKVLEG